MSAWLSQFLEQPGDKAPWLDGNRAMYCIIDRVRHPKALEYLYKQDDVAGIECLFQGTPFNELNDVSPLWLPVKAGTAVAAKAAELCLANRSGILISSNADPQAALLHAKRLLRMNVRAQGDVLARFYDPAFWSALALTASAQMLYGPWQSVHIPPANAEDTLWRAWLRPQDRVDTSDAAAFPLHLEDHTLAASIDIRGWYWVRARASELAAEISDEQLPVVLGNLSLLVEHGIDEGRHLERLLPRLNQALLHDNPHVMGVLSSDMSAFEKVKQLEV